MKSHEILAARSVPTGLATYMSEIAQRTDDAT
jgi:hypothetical protein